MNKMLALVVSTYAYYKGMEVALNNTADTIIEVSKDKPSYTKAAKSIAAVGLGSAAMVGAVKLIEATFGE